MGKSELLSKLAIAARSLDKRLIKTRDMGQCMDCGIATSSGVNKLCHNCAVDVIYAVLNE